MPWSCPICKEEAVPVVLVPCGHSYCVSCAQKATTCGFCRVPKDDIVVSVESFSA